MLGSMQKMQPVAKLKKYRFTVGVTNPDTKQVLLKGFVLEAEIEGHFKSAAMRMFVAKHKLINLWRDQLRTGFESYQWLKPWFSADTETFFYELTITNIEEI